VQSHAFTAESCVAIRGTVISWSSRGIVSGHCLPMASAWLGLAVCDKANRAGPVFVHSCPGPLLPGESAFTAQHYAHL
jgi:hypothetical protein